MDKDKARALLELALQAYRDKSYAELRDFIGEIDAHEVAGPNGSEFQVEIQALWDYRPDGDIRVLGGIDDGGWSAFKPLSDSFVMAPDGTFVGE